MSGNFNWSGPWQPWYSFIYSFSITEEGPHGCKCFYPAMSNKFCHHCLRNNPIDFGNFGCLTRQYTCLNGQTCVQIKLVYNSAPIMHVAHPRATWYQHFIAEACILYVSNLLTSKNVNILKTIKSFAFRCYLFKRPVFFLSMAELALRQCNKIESGRTTSVWKESTIVLLKN